MLLSELLKILKVIKGNNFIDFNFDKVSYDSRDVSTSSVFFAYKGEKYDSHNDAVNLYKNGAIKYIVSEKDLGADIAHSVVVDGRVALGLAFNAYFGEPLKYYKSIAITGTNGKTTSAFIMSSILKEGVINIGTAGIYINGEKHESNNTTPSPYEFYSALKLGLEKGCRYLVIEVSSHALAQKRLAGAKFDVAIFTNLSGDHLDFHSNMENYFEAKSLLFKDDLSAHRVVNIDDEYGLKLSSSIDKNLHTYSINSIANVYAEKYECSIDGIKANIIAFGEAIKIRSKLFGAYNLQNILGAIVAAKVLNISNKDIEDGINNLKSVAGRLDKVQAKGVTAFIDYAHTDDALKNVLECIKYIAKGRIITIFGCGGDRDKTKRPRMLKVAKEHSDIVIVTSDNPRTEDAHEIIKDIIGLNKLDSNIYIEADRQEAIKYAVTIAKSGDIILIAGKGHEDYQIIGANKIKFDDKLVAKKYLEEL